MMIRGTEIEHTPVGERSGETHSVRARFATLLENFPPQAAVRVAVALVLALVAAEALMAFEVSLLLLYVLPVGLVAWAAPSRTAYALAFLAVAVPPLVSVLFAGLLMDWVVAWSVLSNFVVLAILVALTTTLKHRLADEASFVATDMLTGLPNRGSFMARLDAELARSSRYGRAFTLAYIDLDNFKAVNDLEGHDVGDELLRRIAHVLRGSTRQTDVLGRLGGDEFAAILPETAGGATGSVLENLRKQLVQSMAKGGWPVTVSIGAVTFEVPIETSREALQVADVAMYSVKRSGKDGIQHVVWDGDPDSV